MLKLRDHRRIAKGRDIAEFTPLSYVA